MFALAHPFITRFNYHHYESYIIFQQSRSPPAGTGTRIRNCRPVVHGTERHRDRIARSHAPAGIPPNGACQQQAADDVARTYQKAGYQKKEAFAAYLPGIDFNGGYLYNQRELSIFDSDQLLPVKSFDLATQSYQFNIVKNPVTGEP